MRTEAVVLRESRVCEVLFSSGLCFSIEAAAASVATGLSYVNGAPVCCRFFCVSSGDFLQLVVSLKYYSSARAFVGLMAKKRDKARVLVSRNSKSRRNGAAPRREFFEEIPLVDVRPHFETDFFSLSAFFLYEPFSVAEMRARVLVGAR